MRALLAALAFAVLPVSLFAQDVCCVLGKKIKDGVETQAITRSSSECKAGMKEGDYSVCTNFADPSNLCPDLVAKTRCQRCGYFWAGTACLTEDPVKKAKEELKKEAEKEKKPQATPTASNPQE